MRVFHELIADEWLNGPSQATAKFYWEPVMGAYENMKIFFVFDSVTGTTANFSSVLLESSDIGNFVVTGLFFLQQPLTIGQSQSFTASLTDATPLSHSMILSWSLDGTGLFKAHSRVWVTGRGRA